MFLKQLYVFNLGKQNRTIHRFISVFEEKIQLLILIFVLFFFFFKKKKTSLVLKFVITILGLGHFLIRSFCKILCQFPTRNSVKKMLYCIIIKYNKKRKKFHNIKTLGVEG
jgi:hypothetical protein